MWWDILLHVVPALAMGYVVGRWHEYFKWRKLQNEGKL